MNRLSRLACVSLFFFLCAYGRASSDLNKDVDSYIEQRITPTKFSGEVLVARQGRVIFQKSYGMADYEHDVPNSRGAVFRIGSLTKPITAAGILVLQKQSRLNVTDPIEKYIPNLPEEWKKVQIHHLLSHGSGIPELFGDMEAVAVEDTAKEIDRVIGQVENRSLRFQPGTKYEYTNFNYCLLGYICEKVSGQTYPSFLKANVFDTAGMDHTFYDEPRPIIKGRAEGYVVKQGELLNDRLTDPAGYAAGGLLSTAEDLFRFDQALYSGKLVSSDVLSAMFSPVNENYGYGWQVTKHFNRTAFNHRGGTHGFSSYMVRFPEEDNLFVAVISNVEEQSARAVACDVAALMFQAEWPTPSGGDPTETAGWKSYVGDFLLTTGETRTIAMKSGDLYYVSGDSEYKLLPLSSDEFFFEEAEEIRLKFVKNADDSVEMVRSACGQEEMRARHR